MGLDFAGWMQQPRWTVGASLLRIALGFIVFSFYVLHLRQRYALWGNSGVVRLTDFQQWFAGGDNLGVNVFTLAHDSATFDLLFYTGLVVTIMFMVGAYTRLMTLPFAVFTWSIYHRNPFVTDGGTRLLCIVVIYLILADLGSRYSVDAWRRANSSGARRTWLSHMLHNTSIMLVIIQLCTVYMFSTFYKITGPAWQQGTAIYYALVDPQFHISPLVQPFIASAFLVTLATYSTLLYQAAFPWLILHPRLKYAMILMGFGFHTGIAVLMGLWWFSAVLIACETVLMTDAQYALVFGWARRVARFRRVEDDIIVAAAAR